MSVSIIFLVVTVVVGAVMGLLGGGGTILLVPLLTYIGNLPAKEAIPTSLVVVTTSAVVSTLLYARKKLVAVKQGIVLALFAMGASYVGGRLAAHLPSPALLVLFASLMLASSIVMFRPKKQPQTPTSNDTPQPLPGIFKTGIIGAIVGFVTGLVGAGGGFIIVPVLVLIMKIDMRRAVATSLFVISLNSSAALVGHLSHITLNWTTTIAIAVAMLSGTVAGTLLSPKIDASHLKKGFAVMVFAISIAIFVIEVPNLIALF